MQLFNFIFLLVLGVGYSEKFPPYPVPSIESSDLPHLPVLSLSKCQPNGIDLIVAMDSSASIGQDRFKVGIEFLQGVARSFQGHIGSAIGQTQIGLFLFDDMQVTKFQLDSFKTSDEIVKYLDILKGRDQNGTDSLFIKAVTCGTQMLSKARGGKFHKVLLFVSDGWTDEDQTGIAQAAVGAQNDHIEIFFIGYPQDISNKTAVNLVGQNHMYDRLFTLTSFPDVSQLTEGCVEPTSGTEYCMNDGTPGCHCPPGYTGDYCESAINYCLHPPIVNSDGDVSPIDFCHGHGQCKYNEQTGSWCVCDNPWTGKWCQNFTDTGVALDRCIGYETNYTRDNPKTTIQNFCNLNIQRCIPDNIDCAINVPIGLDDNNKPYCIPPAHNTPCKCKYPIGWCIPLETGNNVIKSLAPNNAFIDPFFKGSS